MTFHYLSFHIALAKLSVCLPSLPFHICLCLPFLGLVPFSVDT